jgi:hypothetical protein
MPIRQALDVLIRDSGQREPLTKPLTRFRLASALRQGVLATLYADGLPDWSKDLNHTSSDAALKASSGLDVVLADTWTKRVRKQRFVPRSLLTIPASPTGGGPSADMAAKPPPPTLPRRSWIGRRLGLSRRRTQETKSRSVVGDAGAAPDLEQIQEISKMLIAKAVISSPRGQALTDLLGVVSDLAATTYDGDKKAQAAYAKIAPGLGPGPSSDEALFNAKRWQTDVWLDADGIVNVLSQVTIRGDLVELQARANPVKWAENGMFWDLSKRIDKEGGTDGSWSGKLREIVRGFVLYDVVLEVDYDLRDGKCTVEYKLPEGGGHRENLTIDEGYSELTKDERGWVHGEIYKRLGFAAAPYGEIGMSALLAPTVAGSWLRLQLDVWSAR